MRALKVMCDSDDGDFLLLEVEERRVIVGLRDDTAAVLTAQKARRLATWLSDAADMLDPDGADDEGPEVV